MSRGGRGTREIVLFGLLDSPHGGQASPCPAFVESHAAYRDRHWDDADARPAWLAAEWGDDGSTAEFSERIKEAVRVATRRGLGRADTSGRRSVRLASWAG